MMQIQIRKTLSAAQGPMTLNVEASLERRQFLAITGPSGSGKTTLLRVLAGLTRPDFGFLLVGDRVWLDTRDKTFLPPQKRDVGMVFQDYALFPNMTVGDNLRFALGRREDSRVVDELIDTMELAQLTREYPKTLSGGQRQRVALARALVRRPDLLLLDEPLSALDTDLRQRLQNYILRVHGQFGLTTILVSHDYGEIRKLADQVWRLDNGRITYSGTPQEFPAPENWAETTVAGTILRCASTQGSYLLTVRLPSGKIMELPYRGKVAPGPGRQIEVAISGQATVVRP